MKPRRRLTDFDPAGVDALDDHHTDALPSTVQCEMRHLRAQVLHLTTDMAQRIESLQAEIAKLTGAAKAPEREALLTREVHRLRSVIAQVTAKDKQ